MYFWTNQFRPEREARLLRLSMEAPGAPEQPPEKESLSESSEQLQSPEDVERAGDKRLQQAERDSTKNRKELTSNDPDAPIELGNEPVDTDLQNAFTFQVDREDLAYVPKEKESDEVQPPAQEIAAEAMSKKEMMRNAPIFSENMARAAAETLASMSSAERRQWIEAFDEFADTLVSLDPKTLQVVFQNRAESAPGEISSLISQQDVQKLQEFAANHPESTQALAKFSKDIDARLHSEASSESNETLPTPNEQLWAEFVELGEGLENAKRSERLRRGFMEMPKQRAEAMLSVYEDMTVEERAQFDGVLIKNSALLSEFSPAGFRASIDLLSASSLQERNEIVAGLPKKDQKIIQEKWSRESSAVVQKFLAKVDVLAQSKEEVDSTAKERVASLPDSPLKAFFEGLLRLLERMNNGMFAEEAPNSMKKKEQEVIDSELADASDRERAAAKEDFVRETEKEQKNIGDDLADLKNDLREAMQNEDTDKEQQLRLRQTELEKQQQRLTVRLQLLEADEADDDGPEDMPNDETTEEMAAIQNMITDRENVAVRMAKVNGEMVPAFIVEADQPEDTFFADILGEGIHPVTDELVEKLLDAATVPANAERSNEGAES